MIRVIAVFCGALALFSACDPEGRKECSWTLEPEPKLIGTTMQGYIPVCVRNRTTNHQDCRYQATLEFAKSAWSRKFRYVDIDADATHAPKVLKNIKFCDSK